MFIAWPGRAICELGGAGGGGVEARQEGGEKGSEPVWDSCCVPGTESGAGSAVAVLAALCCP